MAEDDVEFFRSSIEQFEGELRELAAKHRAGKLTRPERERAAELESWIRHAHSNLRAAEDRKRIRDMRPTDDTRLRERLRSTETTAVALGRCFPRPSASEPAGSRLGGRPNLPDDIAWPRAGDLPLHFVAQINLREVEATLPGNGLPRDGLLLFFAAAGDHVSMPENNTWPAAVLHLPGGEMTAPTRLPPEDLPRLAAAYGFQALPAVLDGDARTKPLARSFPDWPIRFRRLRQYRDEPHRSWSLTAGEQDLYPELQRAAELEAYVAAFGPPPRSWSYYMRSTPGYPLPHQTDEPIWMAGEDWPQTYLHGLCFAWELDRRLGPLFGTYRRSRLERFVLAWQRWLHPSRFTPVERIPRAHKALARARDRAVEAARAGAQRVLGTAPPVHPFAPLPAEERDSFRRWVRSLPFDAGPLSNPLGPGTIGSVVELSFAQATDALLGYAPEASATLSPNVHDFVRERHVPYADHSTDPRPVRHHLLGLPVTMHGTPDVLAPTHRLLAQFDTDKGMFWMWGDAGVLQFWIPHEDFAASRFDRCIASLEGH